MQVPSRFFLLRRIFPAENEDNVSEVILMGKKGMSRPEKTHTQAVNDTAPVPELQGKAKSSRQQADPIMTDSAAPSQKVFHQNKSKKS